MVYYRQSYGQPTLKAEWNMDDEVLKIIKALKTAFIIYIKNWDLENAYFTLRQIRMEIDSKLKGKQQSTAKTKIDVLEKERMEYLKDMKTNKRKFYRLCEDYYIYLGRLMQEHGLYFREKIEDEGL